MDVSEEVLQELLRVRKRYGGLTQNSIADCPVLTRVLGNGDPVAAFSSLVTAAKTHRIDLEIGAALHSLGIGLPQAGSVLSRLEAIAADQHVDQRTARRRADDGMSRLASLIATNWTLWVPTMRISLREANESAVLLGLGIEWPTTLVMEDPIIAISQRNEDPEDLNIPFVVPNPDQISRDGWELRNSSGFLALNLAASPLTVRIQWVGEMWPQFVVHTNMNVRATISTLGNRFNVVLRDRATSGSASA